MSLLGTQVQDRVLSQAAYEAMQCFIVDNDVMILGCNNREEHLFTLEAIFQHEIRPKINGKDEFRTKTLSIIF
jgi:hypothetical protein